MTSLLDFPVEIVSHILDFVAPDDSPTWFALVSTCRALNELATTRLYHHVMVLKSDWEGNAPMPKFLMSVMSSPLRAAMVSVFGFAHAAFDNSPEAQDFIKTYKARLRNMTPSNEILKVWDEIVLKTRTISWWEATCMEESNHLHLLATMCLPKVKLLLFGHFTWIPQESFSKLLDCSVNVAVDGEQRLPLWPSLEEVIVEGAFEAYPDKAWPVFQFARLPHVKIIRASGCGGSADTDVSHSEMAPANSSDLQEIYLQPRCKLQHTQLDNILRIPRGLKVFKYNAGHTRGARVPFKTRWLQESLNHQADSLEVVSLTNNNYDWMPRTLRDEVDEVTPMCFSKFSALKELEISLPFVFGRDTLGFAEKEDQMAAYTPKPTDLEIMSTRRQLVEILPGSIEVLRFAQCGDFWAAKRLDDALVQLASWRSEKFPHLHTVEIHIRRGLDDPAHAVANGLLELHYIGIHVVVAMGGPLATDDIRDTSWPIPLSETFVDQQTTIDRMEILDLMSLR
ncbi:hypothetical protein F4778DRAFT_785941 [Xylariomycetidae sp. FL2044]|nr:hypothetical protein F4778DRAFT_785941 [Xylariomycetidae sp. FL2044]